MNIAHDAILKHILIINLWNRTPRNKSCFCSLIFPYNICTSNQSVLEHNKHYCWSCILRNFAIELKLPVSVNALFSQFSKCCNLQSSQSDSTKYCIFMEIQLADSTQTLNLQNLKFSSSYWMRALSENISST